MIGSEYRSGLKSLLTDVDVVKLFGGRIITAIGDSFYFVAATWLVFELTGSTFYTGLAGALSRGPQALRFLAGPLIDRVDLRLSLVIPQIVQVVIVLVVPAAAYVNQLSVTVVLGVILALSTVGQLDNPAQNAAVPKVVDEDLLVRANSIYSTVTQGANAISNTIAGILVSIIGAVGVYVLDAVTFLIATLLFLTLNIGTKLSTDTDDEEHDVESNASNSGDEGYFTELRNGLQLVQSSVIFSMIVASALGNFLIVISYAVLPAYADLIGGAKTYGILFASIGAGMFVGSLVASGVEERPFGHVTILGFLLASCSWAIAILASHRILTAIFIAISGSSLGVYNVLALSALQTGIPDDYLGRVMAFIGSANGIVAPIGYVVGGVLGQYFSLPTVLLAPALGFGLVALYWLSNSNLRGFRPVTEISPGEFELTTEQVEQQSQQD